MGKTRRAIPKSKYKRYLSENPPREDSKSRKFDPRDLEKEFELVEKFDEDIDLFEEDPE